MKNFSSLLRTDAYKLFHQLAFPIGMNKNYSYMCPRYSKEFKDVVFFGLQYYIKEFLCGTFHKSEVESFLKYRSRILGPTPPEAYRKMMALGELGYLPIKIKAIPEGTILPVGNAVTTVVNTHEDFAWTASYLESLLLKVWHPTTVATQVYEYRKLVNERFDRTVDESNHWLKDWINCDFGYRSCTSDESAAISGAAFLIFFKGSDTIISLPFIDEYYKPEENSVIMGSVAATEHAVVAAYRKENEFEHYERMLEIVPEGILSCVSDTYNIWNVCTNYLPRLKDKILARNGKWVLRPDSGVPEDIVCGDSNLDQNSPAGKGCLRLLDEVFGHTINEKGFKVLNDKVGLIYGDSMSYDRYKLTLDRMESMGYAASNLVIGAGGILRRGHRDSCGFATKTILVEVDGKQREVYKEPITDSKKKSHCGYLKVYRNEEGVIVTKDRCTPEEESEGLLTTVFENGKITKEYTFDEVRANAMKGQNV